MSGKLSESGVVRALANEVCRRITRKLIGKLQTFDGDALQSGDDSGLQNTWDEICVQMQFEQSIYWDAYEQTVWQLAVFQVENLPTHERESIWLQTPQGDDWDCQDESEREPYPVHNPDIVQYLISEFLYSEAGRWSNQRIRDYLDNVGRSD